MRPEHESTIGKERALNYALRHTNKEEFVRLITAELPERPGYFAQDAEINRSGAASLADLPPLAQLSADEMLARQTKGSVILDTRPATQFAAGHIPGSVNIPLVGQFASWAGIVLGLEKDLLVVAEDAAEVEESRLRLARVGIEHVTGTLKGGMSAWGARPVAQIGQISAEELSEHILNHSGDLEIIDVRRPPEWQQGHIAGARLMPLDKLSSELQSSALDRNHPLAVHCKSGYRAAIACSLMRKAGFETVFNLSGGFDAWRACGLPVEMPASAA